MCVLLRPMAPPEFGIGAQEFLTQPCAESGSHKNLEQETQLHTRLSRSGSSLSRLARPSLPPRAHACARLPSDPKKQAKLRPWPSSANLSMYVPPGLVGSLEIDFDVNPGRPRTPIRLAPGTARPRHSTRRFIPAPLHSHAGACLPVHLLRRRSTTTSPWEAERPTRSNAGPRIEETKSARRRAWQRGSRIAALVHRALLLLAVLELAAAVATPQNLTRSEPEANNRIHNRILVQLCGGQEPLRGGSQSKPLQEGY